MRSATGSTGARHEAAIGDAACGSIATTLAHLRNVSASPNIHGARVPDGPCRETPRAAIRMENISSAAARRTKGKRKASEFLGDLIQMTTVFGISRINTSGPSISPIVSDENRSCGRVVGQIELRLPTLSSFRAVQKSKKSAPCDPVSARIKSRFGAPLPASSTRPTLTNAASRGRS